MTTHEKCNAIFRLWPQILSLKGCQPGRWMRFLYCQPNELWQCCCLELKVIFHIDSRQVQGFFSCRDIKWNKNDMSITGIRKKPTGIDGSSVDNAEITENLCNDEFTFIPYSLHELARRSWVCRGRGRVLQGEACTRICASGRRCLTKYSCAISN